MLIMRRIIKYEWIIFHMHILFSVSTEATIKLLDLSIIE